MEQCFDPPTSLSGTPWQEAGQGVQLPVLSHTEQTEVLRERRGPGAGGTLVGSVGEMGAESSEMGRSQREWG